MSTSTASISIEHTSNNNNLLQAAAGTKAEKQPVLPSIGSSKSDRKSFQLGDRYQVVAFLGEGAYGSVCSAMDTQTDSLVAVKKILFCRHPVAAVRTLRELLLLSSLRGTHPNIINLEGVLSPPEEGLDAFREVYFIQQKMDTDLHRVIRIQTLSGRHCQYFASQIAHGVAFLHSHNIVHRDLKPSNLFVNANCELRIGDFGLARIGSGCKNNANRVEVVSTSPLNPSLKPAGAAAVDNPWTDYVATRWYRAPELLLNLKEYDSGIDMWSLGCIIAEMTTGKSLFPGKNHGDQVTLILEALGGFSEAEVSHIQRQKAREYLKNLPLRKISSIRAEIAETGREAANDVVIDLVTRLLKLNPKQRLTAPETLLHPYIQTSQYACKPETIKTLVLPPRLLDLERHKDAWQLAQVKEMLYEELQMLDKK